MILLNNLVKAVLVMPIAALIKMVLFLFVDVLLGILWILLIKFAIFPAQKLNIMILHNKLV